MTSFGDTKLRNLGDYFARNAKVTNIWGGMSRVFHSYRSKYVTCKNARMTPLWHAIFLAIAVNYCIDYPHIKGKERAVFTTFLLSVLAFFNLSIFGV